MNLWKFAALLIAAACLPSCGRDTGHAKSDLLKLNYQFTAEDFVRASRAGDEKAVGLFLDAGMNVNSATASGTTPLLGAAENNATAVIELLTRQGAAFDQKDKEGWTPLMKAIYGGKVEAVKLLADESKADLNRGLLLASLLGHTDVARVLLKHGAEVDAAGPEGRTPLSWARQSGNAELEKLLLEAGADSTAASSAPTPGAASASPSPTPGSAEREALLKDPDTMRRSPEEAWWKKYGLDLNAADVFSRDSDGDGFSNRDEFLADTSPIDPSSHPAAASRLVWEGYHRERLPYSLEKVDQDTAILRDAGGASLPVHVGGNAGDWKVEQVRARALVDKDGHPYDGSDVRMVDPQGQKIRLVPGIDGPSNTSFASVRLPFSEETQRLHRGQEFTLPDDGGRIYVVLDLREEQVVIREKKSGQTFTISKAP